MPQMTSEDVRHVADCIMRIDGDRDHMSRSDLTCEQTQDVAKLLRSLAQTLDDFKLNS